MPQGQTRQTAASRARRIIAPVAAMCAAAAVLAWPQASGAQSYPNRPIRMIIPFSPGGVYDYIGRLVSPKLAEQLGQSVVVDNRAGGGGVIAMQLTSQAAPDGYTIVLADPSLVINTHVHKVAPYKLSDLAAVTLLTTSPLVVAINSKVPAQSVKELVELSRKNSLNYGSAGVGSGPHLATELFRSVSKANLVHVPFKGVGPAVTALVAGQVEIVFGALAGTDPFIRDGRLRGLATTGTQRAKAMPNVPTLAEAGYPGADFTLWAGVFAPAATPKPIIARLNADLIKVLQDAEVKAGLEKAAIEAVGSSPAEADEFVKAEHEKLGRVIRAAGIQAE
jgi:tripartite-type tricarboxylate transporter receptor subunit TctC